MATTNKYLQYRGDLRAIAAQPGKLVFTTVHPEGLPTALYRLGVEKLELEEIALPCGGLSLAATEKLLWLGGDDGRIYQIAGKAKKLSALGDELSAPATSLVTLSNARLAAACENQVIILDGDTGKPLQTFDMGDRVTALAADPSGEWLAAGTSKGTVSVFECEDKEQFACSDSAKLHEGAVTAMLFEPEELRFFSAGADQKLLLTHARGKLEPEDRGRGASHEDHVTALLHVAGDRFVSAGRDRTCKTWARVGATRPATFDDGVPPVVAAALTTIHNRMHLAIAGADNTVRLILMDTGGRFSSLTHRVYDAYDRAAHLLSQNDVAQRGDAISALGEYDDSRALEMLARQVDEDADHSLRLRCAELLAKSKHPRAAKLLESLLAHRDDKVRMAAFGGLRDASEKDDLRPLTLAIDAQEANVGVAAVEALVPLAKKDEQARQLMIRALDIDPEETRRAALLALEKVFPKDSPHATVIAAKSDRPDSRRLAIIRGFQRKLLDDSRVAGTVRRAGEDPSADVRRTAFLAALLSRPALAKAIRQRDKQLHRQLHELENYEVQPTGREKKSEPPKVKPAQFLLAAEDYQPLLSAMSSRVMDTSLLGARCLALLGDARAFGTLLQLSREEDVDARVQVCQALAALADPRASGRLETLTGDDAAEVRDAAYTALENIYADDPLEAADIGLTSQHTDVRRRALKTLSATVRKSKAKKIDPRARALMLRALNDDEQSVSGEAFKTSLGMRIDGSHEAVLRFALGSVRPSVRREVLTEAMAEDKQDWAKQLLVELLEDPAAEIRGDAYDHLLSQSKGRDPAPMGQALQSRHVDIRLRATESLIQLGTKEAQDTLVTAINDEAEEVRGQVITALINNNAVDVVQGAMASKYSDVRLQAACARALFHDEQAKAPLLQSATAEMPLREADRPQWQKDAMIALSGMGLLGLAEFVPVLLPLLESPNENIRSAAAEAIARCAQPQHVAQLQTPLQHDDPKVRFQVAMGLAYCREATALPVVFSEDAANVLTRAERLMAAVAFGEQGEPYVIAMLEDSEAWVRNAAFFVLLMRDWQAHDGTPSRILAALSAQDARLRLAAARALEVFTDESAFPDFIMQQINDRGQQTAWDISTEAVGRLALLITFGDPHCSASTVNVLKMLAADHQEQWDFAWQIAAIRNAKQISAAAKAAGAHKLPKLKVTADELAQLAFGTYVGLAREQGSYHQRRMRPSFGATVISVRQQAIRSLVAMANKDEAFIDAVRPVLIQTLSDDIQAVRMLAFEQLTNVGVDDQARAAAAIECPHTDLAVEALKLLTEAAGSKGQKVLEDVVLTRDDQLATEAGMLLFRQASPTAAGKVGLKSPHATTRRLAVGWLAGVYNEDAKAKKALADAYQSEYAGVRREAAIALAKHKDERAFEMLIEQLEQADTRRLEQRVLNAIVELGDKRSCDALLDVLEKDADQSIDAQRVFAAVGMFRDADIAPRLLPLLEKDDWRGPVAGALETISGYDQPIYDSEDLLPNRNWLDDQHPRHDEVLASYLNKCLDLNLPDLIKRQIAAARWSLTGAVDETLKVLAVHPDDDLRHHVVEAIGWRLRKRDGPADALEAALEHRDTLTKFLAAVGLARGGKDGGITILLSAVELMADLDLRKVAVHALGELGDARSLDLLLRLASEDGHALQESAAEAIGHLKKSDKADEIFSLLKRLATSSGSVPRRAIVGLRWFDTPSAWDVIRNIAREHGPHQNVVIEQLGYNDNATTKSLLLELLKTWTDAALPAAKRLFGDDSLEPDYAALQSENAYYAQSPLESNFHCLERVCAQGEAAKIFEILPRSECREQLAAALMQRDPLPAEAAAAALESPHALVVELAASILGRVANKADAKPLGPAMKRWLELWDERFQLAIRSEWWYWENVDEATKALCRLAWAAGRAEVAKAELFALLTSHQQQIRYSDVRTAAISAICQLKLTKTDLKTIEQFTGDSNAGVRVAAADILAREDATRAGEQAADYLSDRAIYRRLLARDVEILPIAQKQADHAHYQAIVLPQLVDGDATDRLAEVAGNKDLPDGTRLGAIEGLSRIASAAARKHLVKIGKDDSGGEEICKAAWRGLRRSKRISAKKSS